MFHSFQQFSWKKFIYAGLLMVLVLGLTAFSGQAQATTELRVCPSGCTYVTIQAAIDAAAAGDTILVYPGDYSETATDRYVYPNNGPYQFGLYIGEDKAGLKIVGVDADWAPITDPTATLAHITTNATNSFGSSGIFVQGDNVTIQGLDLLNNLPEDNKAIEVIGNGFTLMYTHINVIGGGSVYIDDWRFDKTNQKSYVEAYTIDSNWFDQSASLDIASGPGYTGDVSGRVISNNTFTYTPDSGWAAISFSGIVPSVGWYVDPVGGATITGNTFSGGQQYIRARGTYAEASFDWASYWEENTFDKAVMAGQNPPGEPTPYSYTTSGGYFIENTRVIGAIINDEIAHAQPGDTVLMKAGLYVEDVVVGKAIQLIGAGDGDDPAVDTILRHGDFTNTAASDNKVAVTLAASGTASAPLLIKDLRVESIGRGFGVATGTTVDYVTLDHVYAAGNLQHNDYENSIGLYLDKADGLTHFNVIDSAFNGFTYGWYAMNTATVTTDQFANITVTRTTFNDNTSKGIYVEKMSEASFSDVSVINNGNYLGYWNKAWNTGIDVNLKYDAFANLTFTNLTVTGNAVGAMNGVGLAVKARGTGSDPSYALTPATLANVTITGGVFSGNERGIRIGEPGKMNASPSNVQIHNAQISGNTPAYTGTGASATGGVINETTVPLNAENNWWGHITGPSGAGVGQGEKVTVIRLSAESEPVAAYSEIDFSPWWGNTTGSFAVSPDTDGFLTLSGAPTTADLAAFGPGAKIRLSGEVLTPAGGFTLDQDGVTISLGDVTLEPSSPCFTVNADDITILGPGVCRPSSGSDGIIVNAGVDRFMLRGVEIDGAGRVTDDGLQFLGASNGIKVLDNTFHDLGSDGIELAAGAALSDYVIQGNLFKNNADYGVNNQAPAELNVEYNAWGSKDGPVVGGDGASGSLDYDPWTHAALAMQSSGSPVTDHVAIGETISYTVQLEARALTGADFALRYDPTKLAVVNMTPGSALMQDSECKLAQTSGRIAYCGYAFTPVNGSVTAFSVVFRALAAGSVTLDLDETSDAFAMTPEYGDSNLILADRLTDSSLTIADKRTLGGKIDLQGRSDESGVSAALGLVTTPTFGYGPYAFAVSDMWGNIGAANVVDDTYTVTVSMARYLDVTLALNKQVTTSTAKNALNKLVMIAGDADDSNEIGLSDVVIVAVKYGQSLNTNADINGDGRVNLLDLVLVGGNYGTDNAEAYGAWVP